MTNKLNIKRNRYEFSILRPGGNDTLLIKGLVKNPINKKLINDQAMGLYPNVEQVGFYEFNSKTNTAILEMAGGEFCGNALRSLAFLLLDGEKGEMKFKVSGVKRILKAGVSKKNTAYAQMPVLKDPRSVRKIEPNLWLVALEGISHLIKITPQKLNPDKAKMLAKRLLQKTSLLNSKPAAGVMFVKKSNLDSELKVEPVVWVRDIETFFYETACASGTAALGLWKTKDSPSLTTKLKVKQPSGYYINALVKKSRKFFTYAQISGSIKLIEKCIVQLKENRYG